MLKTNGKNLNCAIGVLSKYFNSTLIRFFKSLRIKYCKKKNLSSLYKKSKQADLVNDQCSFLNAQS